MAQSTGLYAGMKGTHCVIANLCRIASPTCQAQKATP